MNDQPQIKTVREIWDAGIAKGVTLKPNLWIHLNEDDTPYSACAAGVLMLGVAPDDLDPDFSVSRLYDQVSEALGLDSTNWSFARNRFSESSDEEPLGYEGYTTLENAFDRGVCEGKFNIDHLLDLIQKRVDEERALMKETASV